LDEISEISPNIQLKLLRVIQESEFERVGGEKTIAMKARIIAASNKSLEELVRTGKFREDLFYRLNVFTIEIPPLRSRVSDIPFLVDFFIQKSNQAYSKEIKNITKEALNALMNHNWPGNIRELEHTITRAMLICTSDTIDYNHIQFNNSSATETSQVYNPYRTLKEVEKEHIEKALEALNWQKEKVAKLLDISRPTLNQKIELYGIFKKME
jgi:transcriptional regulator with PAS, ATPase and Fis domain